MMNRRDEIRNLLSMTPAEVREVAGEHLIVCRDLDALHRQMALDILDEIRMNNARGTDTRIILPVGPTGQYPVMAEIINWQGISLKKCWLFFMDEYCDTEGRALPASHPLSFKRIIREQFLDELLPALAPLPERVIFPDELNISALPRMIGDVGGIDTCYGGVGIHGHIAFNEPEAGVRHMPARQVQLNPYTVTINAIRSSVGGNLEGFPRQAYTLGLREILAARRIRLYCRNNAGFEWANTVLRLALFGEPGDDYPVTHIRDHEHYTIITDENTLASPPIIL